MKVFDNIKSKNINELAEWLDKYGAFDNSPWSEWFDKNYCSKCGVETRYDDNNEYSWCELYNYCRFFDDMYDMPDNKEVIQMWLESEDE